MYPLSSKCLIVQPTSSILHEKASFVGAGILIKQGGVNTSCCSSIVDSGESMQLSRYLKNKMTAKDLANQNEMPRMTCLTDTLGLLVFRFSDH
jgi:hypothetical protein